MKHYISVSRHYFTDSATAWEFAKAVGGLNLYDVLDYGIEDHHSAGHYFVEVGRIPDGV